MKAKNPVESPCIHVCLMDEQDLCIGCRRTLTEIATWSQLSDEQRREILCAIERRDETTVDQP